MVFLKLFFEKKNDFEKYQQTTKKHEKLPSRIWASTNYIHGGILHAFLLSVNFFKINFFEKFFHEYISTI